LLLPLIDRLASKLSWRPLQNALYPLSQRR